MYYFKVLPSRIRFNQERHSLGKKNKNKKKTTGLSSDRPYLADDILYKKIRLTAASFENKFVLPLTGLSCQLLFPS